MVQDSLFLNPLNNPIFIPIIQRFFWVFVVGFFLILILNKLRVKGLWKTNVGKRYLSWLVIGIIYLAVIFFGGVSAITFLVGIMILALWEITEMAKLPRIYFYVLSVLAGLSVLTVSFVENSFYMLPILFFTILTTLTIRRNDEKGFDKLAFSFYVSIWIIFFLCHFILLGHLNNALDNSKALLLLIGFAVPLADIGAYIVGKSFSHTRFDRLKIADKISKNKSWAGTLGNILGAGIGIWIMSFALVNYFSFWQMALLAVLIGMFSVIGDMNESLIKRFFNVKDSSHLIPGHGGILDRVDSMIRVIVVVYYFSLAVLFVKI